MKLYLASGNAHKAQEFQALAEASRLNLEFLSARAVGGMPPVEEDTGTFVGNARKKAIALKAKLPDEAWVLADDSGLCVDALNGAPGVESAYYAGPHGDSGANLTKLITVLRGVPAAERSARFVCVLLLRGPNQAEHVVEATCEGSLREHPLGDHGFGYDPLFQPAGLVKSMAELTPEEKNHLSHRGKAWAALVPLLRATFGSSRKEL